MTGWRGGICRTWVLIPWPWKVYFNGGQLCKLLSTRVLKWARRLHVAVELDREQLADNSCLAVHGTAVPVTVACSSAFRFLLGWDFFCCSHVKREYSVRTAVWNTRWDAYAYTKKPMHKERSIIGPASGDRKQYTWQKEKKLACKKENPDARTTKNSPQKIIAVQWILSYCKQKALFEISGNTCWKHICGQYFMLFNFAKKELMLTNISVSENWGYILVVYASW